jgi:hypothetical protein
MLKVKKKGFSFAILLLSIFVLILIITAIRMLIIQKWDKFFGSAALILFSFVPFVLSRRAYKKNIYIPYYLHSTFLIFVFAALYLGPILEFYKKFWWWDIAIHVVSGLVLTTIGSFIIHVISYKGLTNFKNVPFFEVCFCFFLSVSLHSVWEIYEFVSDVLFKTKMMEFDLIDTMSDMLLNLIGSVIASVYYYLKIKYRQKIRP